MQRGKHDTLLYSPVEHEHEEPLYCPSKQGVLLEPSSSVVCTLKRLDSEAPEHVDVSLMFADPSSIALAVRLPAREIRSTPLISKVEADTVPCSIT
jgi:hypothetical protein